MSDDIKDAVSRERERCSALAAQHIQQLHELARDLAAAFAQCCDELPPARELPMTPEEREGRYFRADLPVLRLMHRLMTDSLGAITRHAAAWQVVDGATGGGTDASKVRRLMDNYKKALNSNILQ